MADGSLLRGRGGVQELVKYGIEICLYIVYTGSE